jgi:D-glycero-alpha-D-manno-heptose-7-phosphate kinase
MIIARAPLRISFVGGGTDLSAFYSQYPGRVLSAAINKYVYVTVTKTPFRHVAVRYSNAEMVLDPKELKNDRVREALLDLNFSGGLEVSTFSHLPGQTGLGSSSAFSVALIKALSALQGKHISSDVCAEGACRLEIDLVGEPIGKQDQYASAFGGINVFQFNQDHSVEVDPVHLDFKTHLDFERHLLLFFLGVTRSASSVLKEQKENTKKEQHFETLKLMAQSVGEFRKALVQADFEEVGNILNENWMRKRSLASTISNPIIDELYNAGMKAGAWGGKILGAGGGGCLLFVVSPDRRELVSHALTMSAAQNQLTEATVLPFSFVQSGAEIVVNTKE